MKKILYSVACLLSAFVAADAQVVKTVNLEVAKHLKDVISSDEALTYDSIAVLSGTINDDDIRFLANCCENGRLSGIDLSSVEISGHRIPSRAFCPSKINSAGTKNSSDGSLSKLHYLRLPLNLRKICESAFLSTGLRQIEIPRTVDKIESNAFGKCNELTEVAVRIPDARYVDAHYAFDKNVKTAQLVVPTGSGNSFKYAQGWGDFGKISEREDLYTIRQINLDGSGLAAQLGSSLLTTDSLVVSGNLVAEDFATMVKSTGDGRLTGIDLTACIVENNAIPDKAFYVPVGSDIEGLRKRKKLLYVTLPKGINSIGEGAFSGNGKLRCINIPSSVTNIGEDAYYGCTYAAGSVTVPEGVSRLAASTFENCSSLTEVRLPSTLSTMDTRSLRLQPNYLAGGWHVNFKINRMAPPKSLNDESDNAFGFDPIDLGDNLRYCTLYVPVGAKPAYEADEMWSCFGKIIETPDLTGKTSGIAAPNVEKAECKATRIYTLDGRYVGTDMTRLGKGVYVVNGKKVVR